MTTLTAAILKAMIAQYGLDAVLKAATSLCDTKAHTAAVIHLDTTEAKRWASAATDIQKLRA